MTDLLGVMWAALGLVAAYLLLPPVLVYFVQRFRRDMQILEFDPDEIPNSKRITKFFDESIEDLGKLNFECLGEFELVDMVPNAKAVLQLYRNNGTCEEAMVTSVWAFETGIVTARIFYTEFQLQFDDENCAEILTSNISAPGAFPDHPHKKYFRLPQMVDVFDLYACHERLVEKHAPRTRRILAIDEEFQGDTEARLRHDLVSSFERQVTETGYLQRCELGWRPTVYGALMMTWRELWPFKQMRTAALLRQGRRLAAELEQEFGPLAEE